MIYSMTEQPAPPSGPRRATEGRMLGPYRLVRRLASGGLSAVFIAEDTRDGTQVALKVFKPEVNHNPELVWLAERSLAVTRQLHHPNLIQILDGGVHDDRRYTVMEYIAGGRTLAQELAEGSLPLALGLNVLLQTLEAIDTIHAAGMAHRDIKPDNVLLLPAEAGYRVKIIDLDFLGPIGHRRLARVREILGTPKYMAPEEIHRGYPHPRGDLFSLGVMTYEMFSGREPFKVEKEVGYLYANRFGTATPLRQIRPDLPAEVTQFVHDLLARQPGERYDAHSALHDCKALERAYAEGGAGGPVKLVAPPRIRRWSKLKLALLAAGILLPLALTLLWGLSREQPAALLWADATRTLSLPGPAPLTRPAPLPAWVPVQPPGATPSQPEREWLIARLTGQGRLLGARTEAIALLTKISIDPQHPYRDNARGVLAQLQEQEYLRLRRSQPRRALVWLRQAHQTATSDTLQQRLSREISRFEQTLKQRRLADRAPEGFVLCPGSPPVFISRKLVSNLAYLAYVQQRGAPAPASWNGDGPRPGLTGLPAAGIAADSAAGYAGWLGARLPRQTELQSVRDQLRRARPEWVLGKDGRVVLLAGADPAEKSAGFRIALTAGRSLRKVPPARPKHKLQLRSSPSRATVRVAGRIVGRTPLTLPVYIDGLLVLRFELDTHLPAQTYLSLAGPTQRIKTPLYAVSVLPAALRDYASKRESAYKLLALAPSKPPLLAQNLEFLVLEAHPNDWRVLNTLRDRLRTQKRPALIARIDRTLVGLDRRIDLLRTQRYTGKLTNIDRLLSRVGYGSRYRMAAIRAGQFYSGAENPQRHEQRLKKRLSAAYWIDRYEVTNQQYGRFIRATGHSAPSHFVSGKPPAATRDHPVTHVSLTDARLYARWIGKRLPTEHEWEKAARGELYRRYPWGKDFWDRQANSKISRIGKTRPVGSHPGGKSVYGLHDLAGNVWELTETSWSTRWVVKLYVLKGGSYRSGRSACRVGARQPLKPTASAIDVGFRCAAD